MRMLSYVFETTLEFSEPVTNHSFVLRCLPKFTNTQKVMGSQVFTNPRIQLSEQVDGFGNRIVAGYCPSAHDSFDFYASGLVMVDTENAGPTPSHPMYLQFTPLTSPDDAIIAAVKEQATLAGFDIEASKRRDTMGHAAPNESTAIMEFVEKLSEYVYSTFEYLPGSTDTATDAASAFALKKGVCQDYSQVLISLCRVAGIPARYVTGLMRGEGASHAWVEVHDGIRWRGVDPTNNRMVGDDYMLFCTGRDFKDCPIERGVFRGNAVQTQKVNAQVGFDGAAVSPEFV